MVAKDIEVPLIDVRGTEPDDCPDDCSDDCPNESVGDCAGRTTWIG